MGTEILDLDTRGTDGYRAAVVTYGMDGETICLSQRQIDMLEQAGTWPRNSRGTEMVDVQRGMHSGYTTYSDAALRREVGI